jgi:bifunctional UDP-N-acetylglucosamine pyrophosphorylase/glucosamine-1-phosphate N-acetyltransferase
VLGSKFVVFAMRTRAFVVSDIPFRPDGSGEDWASHLCALLREVGFAEPAVVSFADALPAFDAAEGTEDAVLLGTDRPLVSAESLRRLLDAGPGPAGTALAAPDGVDGAALLMPAGLVRSLSGTRGPAGVASLVAAALARGARRVQTSSLEELGAGSALAARRHATERRRRQAVQALLAAGVLVEDPPSTFVGSDVVVEAGAVLRPFTFLEGRTVVRRGATVGPFARLVDTVVGEEAQVLDHCLLLSSTVEAGASVGPFAHLRPESRVGPGARVGNFVELKKTSLGAGSKASHLSYLGDAVIAEGVNIGAGTITCNYDGTHKHQTHVERGAFVGSDSTLVAPVTVGEGAYVGAGSTITEDVPAHALALGRSRQVVKPDWARKRAAQGSPVAKKEG